jgi:hypothetical protein
MTEHSIEPDDRGLVLACPKGGQRNRMVYVRLGHKFHCAQCHTELSSPSQPIEVKKEAVTGRSFVISFVEHPSAWWKRISAIRCMEDPTSFRGDAPDFLQLRAN